MARPDGSDPHDEHVLELVIGKLLRTCVIVTSVVVIVGAVRFLPGAFHTTVSYGTFHGEPAAFRSVVGILRDAVTGDGRAIVEAGMLLLVLTPILRVAFSAFAFLHEKDYLYVGLTLVVLGLLLFSLLAG
jgi:uncharacterized membrane protein